MISVAKIQMEKVSLFNEITRQLVAEFQPEQVILFGSYAWGHPMPDSDVDIMVIVADSEQKPYARSTRAHRCLRGIRIPMDILVRTRAEFDKYRHVPASFQHKIITEGKVLYERSAENRTGA